jgi:superfamily II DNA/RNA helicase
MDRAFIAGYLVNVTPKFPTFLKIVKQVVIEESRRLIVFLCWPTPQFDVEGFLKCLGFRVLCVRAGMSAQERAGIEREFNDPKSDVEILVVTYSTCSFGLNLHHMCAAIVMLEPAINSNTTLQVVGRGHRLGQKYPQRIWILSGENTFDRFVEWNQARKMLGQIVGMGNRTFENLDPGLENNGEGDMDFNETLGAEADILYQQLLGQKSSRLAFDDMKDLGLSESQKGHIKNLSKRLSSVRFETKSKATLQPVTPVKAKPKGPADPDATPSNNKPDGPADPDATPSNNKPDGQADTDPTPAPKTNATKRAGEADITQDSNKKRKVVTLKIKDPRPQAVKDQINAGLAGRTTRSKAKE